MKQQKNLDTLDAIRAAFVRTSRELIDADNQEFYNWQAGKLGNDLFINDPDRASRIHDAAADGGDGSTHAEHIEDFREYAKDYYGDLRSAAFSLDADDAFDQEIDNAETELEADLDRLEQWHATNDSLHQQVG